MRQKSWISYSHMNHQCQALFYSLGVHCRAKRLSYIKASCIWCLSWRTTIRVSPTTPLQTGLIDSINKKYLKRHTVRNSTRQSFFLPLAQKTNKMSVSSVISFLPSADHIYTRFMAAKEDNMACTSKQYSQLPSWNWFRSTFTDAAPTAADGNYPCNCTNVANYKIRLLTQDFIWLFWRCLADRLWYP